VPGRLPRRIRYRWIRRVHQTRQYPVECLHRKMPALQGSPRVEGVSASTGRMPLRHSSQRVPTRMPEIRSSIDHRRSPSESADSIDGRPSALDGMPRVEPHGRLLVLRASVTILMWALFGCTPSRAPRQGDLVSAGAAAEVMHLMLQRYGSARSYEDTGTIVATVQVEGGQAVTTRGEFHTAFDRRAQAFSFRFSVSKQDGMGIVQRGTIWRSGADPTNVWLSDDPHVHQMPLVEAFPYISGSSRGASSKAPELLFDSWVARPGDFAFRLDGEDVIGRVPCFRLRSTDEATLVFVWVGIQDHALRKRFEHHKFDLRRVAQSCGMSLCVPEEARSFLEHQSLVSYDVTLEFDPVFDMPIEASRFDFKPVVSQSLNHAITRPF